jgi:hypothetical protein
MPTFMLEGAAEVDFGAGPLRISITLENTTVAGELRAVAGEGQPDVAVHPRPGLIVLPKVHSVVTVHVVPVDAPRFPPATIAHVNVVVNDGRGADPHRAVLIPIDLSGLSSRDLLVLEPSGSGVIVRSARVMPAPADLGAVGNAARIAAAEILGVQSVDAVMAVNLVVAVDSSASFRSKLEDGSLSGVLQMLAGLAGVLAPGMAVGAAAVGSAVSWITVAGAETIADATIATIRDSAVGTGFRSGAAALVGFASIGNTVTYVLTDAVPADVADLDAANSIDGEARHLVVLGASSAWALQIPPSCPHTFIEVIEGSSDLSDRLVSDRALMAQTIKSLMAGCFAPGTSAYERVGA